MHSRPMTASRFRWRLGVPMLAYVGAIAIAMTRIGSDTELRRADLLQSGVATLLAVYAIFLCESRLRHIGFVRDALRCLAELNWLARELVEGQPRQETQDRVLNNLFRRWEDFSAEACATYGADFGGHTLDVHNLLSHLWGLYVGSRPLGVRERDSLSLYLREVFGEIRRRIINERSFDGIDHFMIERDANLREYFESCGYPYWSKSIRP